MTTPNPMQYAAIGIATCENWTWHDTKPAARKAAEDMQAYNADQAYEAVNANEFMRLFAGNPDDRGLPTSLESFLRAIIYMIPEAVEKGANPKDAIELIRLYAIEIERLNDTGELIIT